MESYVLFHIVRCLFKVGYSRMIHPKKGYCKMLYIETSNEIKEGNKAN